MNLIIELAVVVNFFWELKISSYAEKWYSKRYLLYDN